jgi:hypothetical protein
MQEIAGRAAVDRGLWTGDGNRRGAPSRIAAVLCNREWGD